MVTDAMETPVLAGMGMPLDAQPSRPAPPAGWSGFSFNRGLPTRERRGQTGAGATVAEEATAEAEAAEVGAEEARAGLALSRPPIAIGPNPFDAGLALERSAPTPSTGTGLPPSPPGASDQPGHRPGEPREVRREGIPPRRAEGKTETRSSLGAAFPSAVEGKPSSATQAFRLQESWQEPVRATVSVVPQVARPVAHSRPAPSGGEDGGTAERMGEGQAPAAARVTREDGGEGGFLAEPSGPPTFVRAAAAVRDELVARAERADQPATTAPSERRRSPVEGPEEPILRPTVGEGRRPAEESMTFRQDGSAAGAARPSADPTLAIQAEPARLLARLDRGPDRPPGRRLHIGTVHVTVVRPAAPSARPPAAPPPAPEPPSRPAVWEAPRYQDPWESAYRWVD